MVRMYMALWSASEQTVKKLVQCESYISIYKASIYTVFQSQYLEAAWAYQRQ